MFALSFYHERLYVSKCIPYVIIDAMIIQSETIQEPVIRAAAPWLEASKTVLFDIETTGLSPRRSHLYLIGAIGCIHGSWTLRQWFAQKPSEESELLRSFDAFLAETGAETLIHYNGDTFDLPYLRSKYDFYGMPCTSDVPGSNDIYRSLRPFRSILGLSSMKQKDCERRVGIDREDQMTGAALIAVYRNYLRAASPADLQLLLLHNHDDLLGLAEILPLLSLRRLFDGSFRAGRPRLLQADGGAVSGTSPADTDANDRTQTLIAEIPLRLNQPLPVSLQLSSDLYALHGGKDAYQACLSIKCIQGTLLHFFSDYRNYYYLPDEDQAIHKSVAAFVDRSHRIRATASTCYQKASGLFLPQPAEIITPAFRRFYDDKTHWLLFREDALPAEEQLHAYVLSLLQTLLQG